ncbi:MAG: ABC transporter ATP-binding protein [Sporichthyaceae bacterium]
MTTATDVTPVPPAIPAGPLLQVVGLEVEFRTREGVAKAVNGVSYSVESGETLAVLGESGCGKSVTAQAIMGIIDSPPGFVTGGQVRFAGQDILTLDKESRRKLRGTEMAMIFQDALSALNPVFTVGWQIGEMFRVHQGMSRKDAKAKAIELMDRVKIPSAKDRVNDYPHQFSGGMRQRVMIAMSIALSPKLLIADEPTTALDVTVQAQVMDLLAELQRESGMALILITHDLGVVADVADKCAVMYAGRIVEEASVDDLYANPAHPYTQGLLKSIPRLDLKGHEISVIKGLPPTLTRMPSGCAFHPRCGLRQDQCVSQTPPLYPISAGRGSACHFWREALDGE